MSAFTERINQSTAPCLLRMKCSGERSNNAGVMMINSRGITRAIIGDPHSSGE
jgi:hypothetical protein